MVARLAAVAALVLALPWAASAQTANDALVLADLNRFLLIIENAYESKKASGPAAKANLSVTTPTDARNFFIADNAYKLIETPAEVRANAVGAMQPNARVISDIAYVDPADVVTASATITGWNAVTGVQRDNLVRDGALAAATALETARMHNPAYEAMRGRAVVQDIVAKSAASRFGAFDAGVPGYRAFRSIEEFNTAVERGAARLEARLRTQFRDASYKIAPDKYAAVFAEAEAQHQQRFPNTTGVVGIETFMQSGGATGFVLPPGLYDEIRDKTDDVVAGGEGEEDGR